MYVSVFLYNSICRWWCMYVCMCVCALYTVICTWCMYVCAFLYAPYAHVGVCMHARMCACMYAKVIVLQCLHNGITATIALLTYIPLYISNPLYLSL